MPNNDINFMEKTIANFAVDAKEKFVQGSAEHPGSIFDRSALDEASKEVIDLMFYIAAAKETKVQALDIIKKMHPLTMSKPARYYLIEIEKLLTNL